MTVRTFYWDPLPQQGLRDRLRIGRYARWRYGNAGDRFNVDLISWAYPGQSVENTTDGPKLMLVGSIARLVSPGDIVNGIGAKGGLAPAPEKEFVKIRGLRGPLSQKAFEQAGYDVTDISFLGDPGLLIGAMFPDVLAQDAERNRVIFIPHYRERAQYRSNPRYQVVNIDALPHDIALSIRRAEHVYTSSLHGLIWAHALGRTATLVAPPGEPMFKYEDYLASVGLPSESVPSLDEALRRRTTVSPPDVSDTIASITMPTLEELIGSQIAI